MFGLSIVDTIYVIIGGGLLFALYHLIKSDERWFQVRMGGLIFVGLMVLVPLLLMRCNPDILMGQEVNEVNPAFLNDHDEYIVIFSEPSESELREVGDLLFGSNILQQEPAEPAMVMKDYVKKKLDDGTFEIRFNFLSQ